MVGVEYRLAAREGGRPRDDAAASAAWVVKHIADTAAIRGGFSRPLAGGYLTSMIGLDKRCSNLRHRPRHDLRGADSLQRAGGDPPRAAARWGLPTRRWW